ncbi:hypothetical protein PF007_g18846 [Phytophthora fragariae]|uniref:Uncharacterized protein n=1 Tax=Phytophthora fragariae TaxID=53985 RepID=A0A6A3R8E1_9STRA|nr:hypothetical protein PF003_g19910 [Phytophthora fragariae]KAE9091528.1 hypothetical protein PF007_g18846 [Phytophthora fragariae]KAE9291036.1 hypothetical protein PF001_g19338 [Phytophthora fragariae]
MAAVGSPSLAATLMPPSPSSFPTTLASSCCTKFTRARSPTSSPPSTTRRCRRTSNALRASLACRCRRLSHSASSSATTRATSSSLHVFLAALSRVRCARCCFASRFDRLTAMRTFAMLPSFVTVVSVNSVPSSGYTN